MMGVVPDHIKLIDVAGSSSLLFGCGNLPADAAVLAAGHEPNGYFWEGVLQYLAGGLLTQWSSIPRPACSAPGATVPCWASYAKNWRNTSTTPRGSPGSSGRQKPRASSSTTEHLPPRPIGGMTAVPVLTSQDHAGTAGFSACSRRHGSTGHAPGRVTDVAS
jgi:hypothetical protein